MIEEKTSKKGKIKTMKDFVPGEKTFPVDRLIKGEIRGINGLIRDDKGAINKPQSTIRPSETFEIPVTPLSSFPTTQPKGKKIIREE